MSPEQWILAAGTIAALITAAATWRRTNHDKRAGVSTDEREARRDVRADWVAFAEQMQRALDGERTESAQLREQLAAKDARIDALEARLQEKSLLIRAQGDHIDLLEADIRVLGGRPRPRPAGI